MKCMQSDMPVLAAGGESNVCVTGTLTLEPPLFLEEA